MNVSERIKSFQNELRDLRAECEKALSEGNSFKAECLLDDIKFVQSSYEILCEAILQSQ